MPAVAYASWELENYDDVADTGFAGKENETLVDWKVRFLGKILIKYIFLIFYLRYSRFHHRYVIQPGVSFNTKILENAAIPAVLENAANPGPDPNLNPKAYAERQAYQAAVSFQDANVGTLMAELKSLGVWETTVIALVGDHGFKLGEHGAWTKHTNFDLDTVGVWGGKGAFTTYEKEVILCTWV